MVALLFLCAGFFMFVLPVPVIRFYPKSNDNICISLFVSRLEAPYMGSSHLKYKGKERTKDSKNKTITPPLDFSRHPHTLNGIIVFY